MYREQVGSSSFPLLSIHQKGSGSKSSEEKASSHIWQNFINA
jgi:hypothetical protein